MWFYQEITLHPTADAPEPFLMSNVYAKLHLALTNNRDVKGKIHCGVAFPEYSLEPKTLGRKIRVLSQNEYALKCLNLNDALALLAKRGYVHIIPIRAVPIERVKQYAIYSRQQIDSSTERKARRYARRHATDAEDVLTHFSADKNDKLPYVWFDSNSTQQNFGLLIQKRIASDEKDENGIKEVGSFSSYGLSKQKAVPEF